MKTMKITKKLSEDDYITVSTQLVNHNSEEIINAEQAQFMKTFTLEDALVAVLQEMYIQNGRMMKS